MGVKRRIPVGEGKQAYSRKGMKQGGLRRLGEKAIFERKKSIERRYL